MMQGVIKEISNKSAPFVASASLVSSSSSCVLYCGQSHTYFCEAGGLRPSEPPLAPISSAALSAFVYRYVRLEGVETSISPSPNAKLNPTTSTSSATNTHTHTTTTNNNNNNNNNVSGDSIRMNEHSSATTAVPPLITLASQLRPFLQGKHVVAVVPLSNVNLSGPSTSGSASSTISRQHPSSLSSSPSASASAAGLPRPTAATSYLSCSASSHYLDYLTQYLFHPLIGVASLVIVSDMVATALACGRASDANGVLVIQASPHACCIGYVVEGCTTRYSTCRWADDLRPILQWNKRDERYTSRQSHPLESSPDTDNRSTTTTEVAGTTGGIVAQQHRQLLIEYFGDEAVQGVLDNKDLDSSLKDADHNTTHSRNTNEDEKEHAGSGFSSTKAAQRTHGMGHVEQLLGRIYQPHLSRAVLVVGEALQDAPPILGHLLCRLVEQGPRAVPHVPMHHRSQPPTATSNTAPNTTRDSAGEKTTRLTTPCSPGDNLHPLGSSGDSPEGLAMKGREPHVQSASGSKRGRPPSSSSINGNVEGSLLPSPVKKRKRETTRTATTTSISSSEDEEIDVQEEEGEEDEDEDEDEDDVEEGEDESSSTSSDAESESSTSSSSSSSRSQATTSSFTLLPPCPPSAPWWMPLLGASMMAGFPEREMRAMRIMLNEVVDSGGSIAYWKALL